MSYYVIRDNDELRHYGVLGMKWGVRKGNTTKAYNKASKKLNKLDSVVKKRQAKAQAAMVRADRKRYSKLATSGSKRRASEKAKKYQYEANRSVYKAKRWLDSMEKTFKDTDIKLSSAQVELGKKYASTLNLSAELKSLR